MIGLEFANVHDASTFKNLVQTYSYKGENIDEVVKEQEKRVGIDNPEISKPNFFERKEHAGWNPSTSTFALNEVPKEIKLLLKKAGFKKKDLKSKETALAIYEILLREIDFDNGPSKGAGLARTASLAGDNLQFKSMAYDRSSKRQVGNSFEDSKIFD